MIVSTTKLIEQRDYWIKKLSGIEAPSNLIPDFQRSKVYSPKKQLIGLNLSGKLYQRLNQVAGNSSFLIYAILMAALKVCLHKYTGDRIIVVGSPAVVEGSEAPRERNAVAIVDHVDERMSFRQFLLNIRQTLSEAYANQSYPFTNVVKDLGIEPPVNRCALFNISLALRELHMEMPDARNDISLTFNKTADQLSGAIEFNPKLFQQETIERFATHMLNVLEEALGNTNVLIHEIKMLTEEEREQLLTEWNATGTLELDDQCVQEMFEAQVGRTPDEVAVIFEGKEHTYREINSKANGLAQQLQKLGVGPEVLVGICVRRSVEMLVGVLGILKAAGAYVPLSPDYPKERLSLMLEDSQPVLVLTDQHTEALLPEHNAQVLRVDMSADVAVESTEIVARPVSVENSAYVLFTSGSMGRPKGIVMPHRPLTNLIKWQCSHSTLSPGARTLQFTSLGFDISFQEIFSTWCAGETLVLASEELRRDAALLPSFLSDNAVERLFLPFVALQQMAEACCQQKIFPARLRKIITAGEQLQITPSIVNLFRNLDGCSLHNHYGPTECHVVSAYELGDSPGRWPTFPPIGKPIANTKIYLLDVYLQPVPFKVPGELHIGGLSLARGYLHRPDLTAENFIPDPFSKEPGARLYKTGDLARYLPDGNIEFLGRRDNQVKVRGYRVEPGEVEAVLNQHEAIRESVVTVREDVPGNKRLVAYLVSDKDASIASADLRDYLNARLPDYMVPATFVLLDQLPLTPSGKVDRRALPAPELARHASGAAFVAPQTSDEKMLAEIWAEVLQQERIGVNDNFFDLGGHSLLATKVISRVHEVFHVTLSVPTFFQSPTVSAMVAIIRQHQEQQNEHAKLAEMLSEIEKLSAEDSREALARESRAQ